VLRIILHRPPANALGVPLIEGLNQALDVASGEAGVKVIVLESGVPGFFAAGADIRHMAAADGAAFAGYGDALRAVLGRFAGPERISIAAVEGLALGGGLELALACTLRVAGAQARFGLPEVKLGLIPGAGGTQRLPRLVGRGRALDIMLTGRQVGAEEAFAIGLVNRLAASGAAGAEALALAGELSRLSRPAQQAVIRTVDASEQTSLPDGLAYEAQQVQGLFETGEAKGRTDRLPGETAAGLRLKAQATEEERVARPGRLQRVCVGPGAGRAEAGPGHGRRRRGLRRLRFQGPAGAAARAAPDLRSALRERRYPHRLRLHRAARRVQLPVQPRTACRPGSRRTGWSRPGTLPASSKGGTPDRLGPDRPPGPFVGEPGLGRAPALEVVHRLHRHPGTW
jgi:enoyl-CoA hydratase/carnithine racemase